MALFHWRVPEPKPEPQVGDVREVVSWLLLPRVAGGEWRWLGRQVIRQEAYMGWYSCPEGPGWEGIKWRNVAWVDEPMRFRPPTI